MTLLLLIMKLATNLYRDFKKKNYEGLKTDTPSTPHFYLKPKVHKEGNPEKSVQGLI